MARQSNLILAARVLLVADASLYAIIGLLVFFRPEFMERFGIELVSATGITTTRTWGALFAGAGCTGLIMAVRRDWLVPGLILIAMTALWIFAGRVYGIWADGVELRQWIELRREGIGLILALAGLGMAVVGERQRGAGT